MRLEILCKRCCGPYSKVHNTYYFYNSLTQETTWTNPLVPPEAEAQSSSGAASTSGASNSVEAEDTPQPGPSTTYTALQEAAIAQGIDPALAHLDPSLLASTSGSPAAFAASAKFNARTGAFTKADGRDPSHLSEYERAG